MVLSRLKNQKDNASYVVALDIGTEYVKALIGKVVPHPKKEGERAVEVVGVGRQHQGLNDMHSGAISDIAGVVDNCDAALKQAEDMSGVTAKNAVIGIAGELVKGDTVTIKYKRSHPKKPIEMAELNMIMDQVKARALERAKAQVAWESGVNDIEIKLVNAAVVNVYIDGYKVNNPIGFQGKDVNIQLFCAFAPMVHIGALERVAFDLDLNLLSVAAEPFAVAKSVGAEQQENFNAIFIDVGGGTSDIALVNDGGVEGTKMFGIGGRSFTNAIAKHQNLDFEAAEELKLKLKDEPTDSKLVKEAVLPTVKVWLSGVELALSEFDNIDQLPSKILLCGGGTGLPYLAKALKTEAWRKGLPFAKDITIEHIKPAQVDRVIDKTDQLTDYSFITPMGLLNLGLDSLDATPKGQGIMNKINRILQV